MFGTFSNDNLKLIRFDVTVTTANVTVGLFVLTGSLIKQSRCLDVQFRKQSYIAKTSIKPFLLVLIKHACLLIYTHFKAFCVTVAKRGKKMKGKRRE